MIAKSGEECYMCSRNQGLCTDSAAGFFGAYDKTIVPVGGPYASAWRREDIRLGRYVYIVWRVTADNKAV